MGVRDGVRFHVVFLADSQPANKQQVAGAGRLNDDAEVEGTEVRHHQWAGACMVAWGSHQISYLLCRDVVTYGNHASRSSTTTSACILNCTWSLHPFFLGDKTSVLKLKPHHSGKSMGS